MLVQLSHIIYILSFIFAHVGTSDVISEHSLLSNQLDSEDQTVTCNKDTGAKKRLQRWTRGHFFIVRAGGHIDSWQPLYQYVIHSCMTIDCNQ